jgi:hypothetical protein
MPRRQDAARRLTLGLLWAIGSTLFVPFMVSELSLGRAQAQSRQLPIAFRDRPLVLPTRTLRADADLSWQFSNRPDPNRVWLDLGGAGGIAEDWEIGTILIPLQLTPDTSYRDPWFYAIYRLQAGPVEFGVRGQMSLPIDGDLQLEVGPPLLVRLGPYGRLDTGFFLRTDFGEPTRFHGRLPAAVAFQVTYDLFLGPEMELWLPTFSRADLMLGGFVGWSLAPQGALLADLVAHLRFRDVTREGTAAELLITADFYFDI